ncbi:zinc ribbon domain-containing protein [Candidatus Woesearchaeota archaeon]|nr:zinc ribbon domain-containing protein [Candidatus Woesearchaeota archaeon]
MRTITAEKLLRPKDIVKEIYCQSCGTLVYGPNDYGTEIDRSKSGDYCKYCYQRGEFTQKTITQEQMIRRCAGFIYARMKVSKEEALRQAKELIPLLRRWKK